MNKKAKILIFTLVTTLLISVSNFTTTQAIIGSWDVGTNVTFTDYIYQKTCSKYLPEDTETTAIMENLVVFGLNITSVNNVTGVIGLDYVSATTTSSTSANYFASNFISTHSSLNALFYFNYLWDYEHNSTILWGFGINLNQRHYLEANWTILNDHFATILNSSTLVDTVNDPYSSTVYNITFGDFLADCNSFTINGQSSLAAAKQQFTSTNTEWSFYFDITGYIKWRIWNGTAGYWQYYDYDSYYRTDSIEFNSGGVLQEYVNDFGYTQIDGDDYYEYQYKFATYNGVHELTTDDSSFGYLLVIPAIATIVIFVKWSRKRKQ